MSEEAINQINNRLDETYHWIIDELRQENQQLKEKIKWYEKENKHNQEIIIKNIKVLDEIRECIEKDYSFAKRGDIPLMSRAEQLAGKLFEILDKVE